MTIHNDTMRAVMINVDDLGLSSAVNAAVIELASQQRISATSYMVGGSIKQADIAELQRKNIDIGLHLDMTGIIDSHLRAPLKTVLLNSYLRKFKRTELDTLIHAQLDAFETRFGHAPIFIDGHQHIHQLPVVRHSLLEALQKRYQDGARIDIAARTSTPLLPDFKSWIIYLFGGRAWHAACQRQGIKTNDRFGGVYGFDADITQLSTLWDTWLTRAPVMTKGGSNDNNTPMTLIMCHPAVAQNDWQDEIKAAREVEYQWLTSAAFGEMLAKYHVKLVRWSDVPT